MTALADDATFHTVKESDCGTGSRPDNKDEDAVDELANASMSQLLKIHKRHPYIVTRMQLHIVDQTVLFNHDAYNKAHNQLKVHACGSGILKVKLSWKRCNRDYKKNGHWETRLELEMPAPGNNSDVQTEWAYGL
ncbi:hypothetical protein PILCRDRAFT_7619 [Piloderma croceum F 1598]|uniref:Uncharacterized protein n=1 Tax=Piloderma croceum (strain F 1598) TaxID=765440 RepID=A0A0C3BZB5_PILCF|nr:hypothetical protein PILCRDRAFT_7619 [Piloderma croceum F 1598]